MPITINDCKICGLPPKIWQTLDGDLIEILVYCHNGHFREEKAYTVESAIGEWNYWNPQKGEEGGD